MASKAGIHHALAQFWSGEAFIMLLLCIENGWFDVTTYHNAVAMVIKKYKKYSMEWLT